MLTEDTKAWHSKLCDMSELEIVKLMEDEEIKAVPGDSKSCAVAVLLHKKTGQKVSVGALGVGLTLSEQLETGDYDYVSHSDSLSRFVSGFDKNAWPQLVKS